MNNNAPAPESVFREWFPRDIIRRTNWLYRVDALCIHDIREMNVIAELVHRHYGRFGLSKTLFVLFLQSLVHLRSFTAYRMQ